MPGPRKIAVAQLPYQENWPAEALPVYVDAASRLEAELVVFPECCPFHPENAPDLEGARHTLCEVAKQHWRERPQPIPFIAGGTMRSGSVASVLVHDKTVHGTYLKRVRWDERNFEPGASPTLFSWPGGSCIPLICADVLGGPQGDPGINPSEDHRKLLAAGFPPGTPVVVSCYGSGLRGEPWRERLFQWASEFRAPVVVCNFAGNDPHHQGFGGGGSGVFWPDGSSSLQPLEAGLFVYDLTAHRG